MTVFDFVAKRDTDGLKAALAADAAVAASRNAEGASLLAVAAYTGYSEGVPLIRAALPSIDPYEAIVIGETVVVKTALDGEWDANGLSPDGFTPLALAAFFGRREIFDLLLPKTGDVNKRATNSQQVAALHAACAVLSVPLVEKLLRAGADPNLAQQHGFVALHTAGLHGDAILSGLLLLAGADPSIRDAGGKNAADHARSKGHDWLAKRLDAATPVPAVTKADEKSAGETPAEEKPADKPADDNSGKEPVSAAQ